MAELLTTTDFYLLSGNSDHAEDIETTVEVSSWMLEKGFSQHKSEDLAIRLDLIGKVNGLDLIGKANGLEEAEHSKNYDKLENLICEMQEEGINFNSYTFGTLISAYAATSKTEGIGKLLAQLEHNRIRYWHLDWTVYAIAANCYRKQGLSDKAFNVLKKSERLISHN
nr:pentatricopeptide repeat-containing protein At2g20710, mitochondrial [Arachis hypogaea]